MAHAQENPLALSPEWRGKTLSQMIDHRATVNPDLIYAEYPNSPVTYDEGFRAFTYSNLANAINGVAHWLRKSLGTPAKVETLAYIGPNDIRIPALIIGASKAGYTIFLTSPRNSIPSHLHLLKHSDCTTLLSSTPQSPAVTALLATPNHGLRHLQIPSIDELVNTEHPPFPFEKTYDEIRKDPLCKVHTSGSTGIPKTITLTHGGARGTIEMMGMEPPEGYENLCRLWQGVRVYAVFPPFHAMYLGAFLFNAVTFGTTMIAPLAAAIPTADGMVQALKRTPFDCGFILPSIVRELSNSPELLDYCTENLKTLFFAGGDLPQNVGEQVASKIPLYNHYGSTESGLLSLLLPQDRTKRDWKDWKYLQLDEKLGCEFEQFNDDEYELVIKRDGAHEKYQPVFELFPDAEEYRMRDLFVQHPTNDKLWRWCARADDIIVFLTGEKTNPISMEQHILTRNPEILGLLVAGAQRFQASLLIHSTLELKTPKDRAEFIEKIWPSIDEANQLCPTHARIAKSHILFTTPSKPMLFSGKGTIQRATTLKLYQEEFDKLYDDADKMTSGVSENAPIIDLSIQNIVDVQKHVRQVVSRITGWAKFGDEEDIFVLGMDSLQAIMIVRQLREMFLLQSISTSTVYTNPSIVALSKAIVNLSEKQNSTKEHDENERQQTRTATLKAHREFIDKIPFPASSKATPTKKTVLLTGSTGALGSYVLHSLLQDTSVDHVYCLNRGLDGTGESRQIQKSKALGLPIIDLARTTFLETNMSRSGLGLAGPIYEDLQTKITHIIHNAWPVNFNVKLSFFESSLDSLVNLVQFAATSNNKTNLLFISSIAADLGNGSESATAYAESKNIAEELLKYSYQVFSQAGKPQAVPSIAIARVGQIAGARDSRGLWNKQEWFPSLMLSSMHLAAIPNSLGTRLNKIDWVPIDVLANALLELLVYPQDDAGVKTYYPLNPKSTSYQELLPGIIAAVSAVTNGSCKLEPISAEDWIATVEKDVGSVGGEESGLDMALQRNPAAKLIDFYKNTLSMRKDVDRSSLDEEIKSTSEHSRSLASLDAVNETLLKKWLEEWVES